MVKTVTCTGTEYATMALAIAAVDAETVTTSATDTLEIIPVGNGNGFSYWVIKTVYEP